MPTSFRVAPLADDRSGYNTIVDGVEVDVHETHPIRTAYARRLQSVATNSTNATADCGGVDINATICNSYRLLVQWDGSCNATLAGGLACDVLSEYPVTLQQAVGGRFASWAGVADSSVTVAVTLGDTIGRVKWNVAVRASRA